MASLCEVFEMCLSNELVRRLSSGSIVFCLQWQCPACVSDVLSNVSGED